MLKPFLLAFALSMDALVSGFAYGTNRIKIPLISAFVVSVICSLILAVSLFAGSLLNPFIPENLCIIISFATLFILGIIKLFDSTTKSIIRKHSGLNTELKFSVFNLGIILNIYANPQNADFDKSRGLSPKEAFFLALALSLDGLGVGFGAALADVNPVYTVLFSLITNIICVLLGFQLGYRLSSRLSPNLSWIGGLILITLAFTKL